MAASVRIIFVNGVDRLVSEHADLTEACDAAFDLADRLGSDTGDGAGSPQRIQVMWGGRIQLSIRVLKGGLSPKQSE